MLRASAATTTLTGTFVVVCGRSASDTENAVKHFLSCVVVSGKFLDYDSRQPATTLLGPDQTECRSRGNKGWYQQALRGSLLGDRFTCTLNDMSAVNEVLSQARHVTTCR